MCRTLDRLTAFVRGPYLPSASGELVLYRLRGWLAELQDIGEQSRGVTPNPLGSFRTTSVLVLPPPAEPAPATAPKSLAKPPEGEESNREKSSSARHRTSATSPERKKKEKHHKKSRKDRSSDSEERRQKKRSRLPSEAPVENPGGPASGPRVPAKEEPTREEREAAAAGVEETPGGSREPREERSVGREEGTARPLVPRPPSRSPPGHLRGARRGEDRRERRPRTNHAFRPLRPPGSGRHYGKNKGEEKRRRNEEYWRRRRDQWR